MGEKPSQLQAPLSMDIPLLDPPPEEKTRRGVAKTATTLAAAALKEAGNLSTGDRASLAQKLLDLARKTHGVDDPDENAD